MNQIDYFFGCPYCFQTISILVDPSIESQEYVEDCEVCCNPIEFNISLLDAEVAAFEAKRMDDY
jgi:transcription elongation factor Elf1